MKIELRILALGLVALFGSLLASSQGISAYQMTDRPSVSLAAGPSVLGTSGDAHTSVIPAPGSPVTSSILFLPMVTKPVEGIFGYLTDGVTPAGGVSLQLRFYNGSNWSTAATATTDPSGYYLFTGMPALAAGQVYYVLYRNPGSQNTRLWAWESREVTSYTPGSTVALGTSDLADIALVSPGSPATVSLPRTFYWTPRAATPSDSYFLVLYNLSTGYYARTVLLGYVSSFYMTILPTGFSPNVQYGWYMRVFDSNGGYGTSYYYGKVTFLNSQASISGPLNMAPHSTGRPDDLPLPPHPEE